MVLAIKGWIAWRLPLFGDEAWYWLEGQHLAWAYSDLPGLSAWLARLGAESAGHGELALRWPFLALSMAVPLLLRAAARDWFGRAAGDQTGLFALLLPLLGSLGFLALPDVPLTFAAALGLYAMLRLSRGVDTAAAVWLAVALAVGALSHYRYAPLLAAAALGMLLDPGARRALRDARVWAALAVGALAWLPLLGWNLAHQNAGWQFQLAERHAWSLHTEGVWLPLSQLLVVSPLLLVALLVALVQAWRQWRAGAQGPWGLVLGSAVLPFLLYLPLAFVADRERVSFHWLLQAWLPLLLLVPQVLSTWRPWLRAATVVLAVAGLGLVLGYAAATATPTLRAGLAHTRLYPDNFAGWPEVAAAVRTLPPGAGEEAELIADNFKLGAQLAFALQRPRLRMLDHRLNHKHGRALQLQLWGLQADLSQLPPRPRLLVVEDSAIPERERLAYYAALCGQAPQARLAGSVEIDRGAKRFALFDLDPQLSEGSGACAVPEVPQPPR